MLNANYLTLCAAPALQTASETPKIAFAPSLAETSNKQQTHDTFRSSCYRTSTSWRCRRVGRAVFFAENDHGNISASQCTKQPWSKRFFFSFLTQIYNPLKLASMEWLLGEKCELSTRENFDCFLSQWEHAIQLICTAEEW